MRAGRGKDQMKRWGVYRPQSTLAATDKEMMIIPDNWENRRGRGFRKFQQNNDL